MAEEVTTETREPGEPFPKDQVDPDLVKLGRPRPRIGLLTAAGVVFLSAYFVWKLSPDRHFASEPAEPRKVTVADIARGAVAAESHVRIDAEPLMAHTLRSSVKAGAIGMRVVPARGSAEKLWLVLPGDGWGEPNTQGYVGRLRPLADLPMAPSIQSFLAANPQPVFAAPTEVRAGFASNKVTTVAGDAISVRDSDRVAFDVIDPSAATVICTFNERHADVAACTKALGEAALAPSGSPVAGREQATFPIAGPDAVGSTRTKLEAAKLWGMAVEPVTQHYETTWGKLKSSAPTGFTVDNATLPDAQLDLVGIYVAREIPPGALVLLSGEKPQDLWYVLPVTILVAVIGLLFVWALVRAVKRDLLNVT